MIHKIVGWCQGYVKIRISGRQAERFVNLCCNGGIFLWGICWEEEGNWLYACISRKDYFHLRPVVRKTGIFPLVVQKFGGVFWLQRAGKRASFWCGVALFLITLFVLSDRIWGIYIEGQSYHTKESMMSYLEENGIYGGIRGGDVVCSLVEKDIRRDFKDIGWTSIEKAGSKLYVRIQEVVLVEEEPKPKPGHLIAEQAGTVMSIVTRQGNAKVRAGDKVKKKQVLISGKVKIIGDGDEVVGKKYVQAQGTVILKNKIAYKDSLEKTYEKKLKTGREIAVYQVGIAKKYLFIYNPLNYLETYEKYDIIREGGLLCPFLSLRFPVSAWKKTFQEVSFDKAQYTKEEAQGVLEERYQYYLEQLEENGYTDLSGELHVEEQNGVFQASSEIIGNKKQEVCRKITIPRKGKTDKKKQIESNE